LKKRQPLTKAERKAAADVGMDRWAFVEKNLKQAAALGLREATWVIASRASADPN
jgi:hypothetical protein